MHDLAEVLEVAPFLGRGCRELGDFFDVRTSFP